MVRVEINEKTAYIQARSSMARALEVNGKACQAMLCKTSKTCKHGVTSGKSKEIKSKFACILQASESTRLRVGESLPTHHEGILQGKGDNSLQHCNLVHKFIPIPQAMKIH